MIYGVEQTTDLRDRQTKIKIFRDSKKGLENAIAWATKGGIKAFADSNNHHRLRSIYRLQTKPQWKKAYQEYCKAMRGHSVYRRYPEDFQAGAIVDHGQRIDVA